MLRLPLELSYLTGHYSVSIKCNSKFSQYKILTYKFTRIERFSLQRFLIRRLRGLVLVDLANKFVPFLVSKYNPKI